MGQDRGGVKAAENPMWIRDRAGYFQDFLDENAPVARA